MTKPDLPKLHRTAAFLRYEAETTNDEGFARALRRQAEQVEEVMESKTSLKPHKLSKKSPKLYAGLLCAQDNKCYLCGKKFPPLGEICEFVDQPSFDHVVPKSKKGYFYGNVVLSHRKCNVKKGNRRPYPCELIYLASSRYRLDCYYMEKSKWTMNF
jgi:hypothetical protein